MADICLITPAHVANNPRLVKEADALTEAGYDVEVIACQYQEWARENDQSILNRADWDVQLVQWGQEKNSWLHWKSGGRQHLCRTLLQFQGENALFSRTGPVALRAYERAFPELLDRARSTPADLYIGHNLQALPIARAAAERHGAKLGFDAEDFHSGIRPETPTTLIDEITEAVEREYLPDCDYVTAASPGIAKAYARKYDIDEPPSILNVFPLDQRPDTFRQTDPSGPLTLYWFSQTIGPRRGLEEVAQALSLIPECDVELHLRGKWHSDEYKQELLHHADPVEDRIIAHDPAPPDEMIWRSARYDVGLAIERSIGNRDICLTNKLFTYLLAGNAIAATSTTGQQQFMEDVKETGFVYEPGDANALAEQLKRWTENRDLLNQQRERAWHFGEERYNWDVEKKKFLTVADTVM